MMIISPRLLKNSNNNTSVNDVKTTAVSSFAIFKVFRCLPRLDSKHLTGFRRLPRPVANGLGLGICFL